MNEVGLIAGMFAVTFTVRFFLFGVAGKIRFPAWMDLALGFVPPAVLTAIIVPAVIMPKGEMWFSLTNPWLVSAVFAVLVAMWRKDLLQTIVLGMLMFLLLRFGFGW
ncbi:AzlD domain-containing protein [Aliamphritea ceti]|uniref:AzlD domain-containing protein n=1 Tax=Aliamphritea ceti TaxID=1524258 RepID=UPI0021C412DF|nr:AzlD domain-containing protein [Aliamphritea ceti]